MCKCFVFHGIHVYGVLFLLIVLEKNLPCNIWEVFDESHFGFISGQMYSILLIYDRMRIPDPSILQNVIPEIKMPNPIVNTDDLKDRWNFELNSSLRKGDARERKEKSNLHAGRKRGKNGLGMSRPHSKKREEVRMRKERWSWLFPFCIPFHFESKSVLDLYSSLQHPATALKESWSDREISENPTPESAGNPVLGVAHRSVGREKWFERPGDRLLSAKVMLTTWSTYGENGGWTVAVGT